MNTSYKYLNVAIANVPGMVLDVLLSSTVGILQFAAGLSWIMVDATSTTPGWLHLVAFVVISLWLMVTLIAGTVTEVANATMAELRSPKKNPAANESLTQGWGVNQAASSSNRLNWPDA